jgi:hypothetical protein
MAVWDRHEFYSECADTLARGIFQRLQHMQQPPNTGMLVASKPQLGEDFPL